MPKKRKAKIRFDESVLQLESKLAYQINRKQRKKEYKLSVSKYFLRIKQLQKLGEKYEKYINSIKNKENNLNYK
jgi:hypothetical protein